jgi:hypothetical protein
MTSEFNELGQKAGVPRGPFLDHLDEIERRAVGRQITLGEIFSILGADGHYVLIIFLTVPCLQPIPLPGLSSPFGILIATVAIFAFLRRPPWVPRSWALKPLPQGATQKIVEGAKSIFERLKRILHPRWLFFFRGPWRGVNTTLIVLYAVFLALPLPIPFSNAVPAWGIFFQALAHLEEDGFFILLSYIQFVVCLGFFALLARGAWQGFQLLGS